MFFEHFINFFFVACVLSFKEHKLYIELIFQAYIFTHSLKTTILGNWCNNLTGTLNERGLASGRDLRQAVPAQSFMQLLLHSTL